MDRVIFRSQSKIASDETNLSVCVDLLSLLFEIGEKVKTYYIFLATLKKNKCQRVLWQYGLWSFQTGYTKLESFLHKN